MAHATEVRPTIAAVANKADPAAKIEVATPGYGLLDAPLDAVGDVVLEVEDPPDPVVVIDLPSALS